ncbi:acetyl- acetyltransferase protein [Rutstroemia sp. NJR-2017a WRK4]|nr:acetyl- acetyltransferase protein [Rutstroemia sp. NJR-2017a WRK4]
MAMTMVRRGYRNIMTKDAEDVVILSSLRTPITRAVKGQLSSSYPEQLLHTVLKATLAAVPNLDPALIDDVCVGVVLSELGGSKAGRMAMNHAGIPATTSFYTTNRACSSGLQAITNVAHSIAMGQINIGIGGGMESMTRNYASKAIPTDLWPELKNGERDTRDCIMPMGLTSENVAERYGVSRKEQDEFAVESHRKAAHAQAKGWFRKEIVPVRTRWQEIGKGGVKIGEEKDVLVLQDDGIRKDASLEGMQKLKPAFKEDGTSTAGNSSQISDGAAATLMMRRSTAIELGLKGSIIGKWVASVVAGCRPDEMGIGPALAIPKLLEYTGMDKNMVGIWEINEAFASQAIYCVKALGLEVPYEVGEVNPKGGAIALGHPLGATGARMVASLLAELERTQRNVGVISTGMGMAGMFVREYPSIV